MVTVVGTLLGILCAALGFAAEAKRVKVNKREEERERERDKFSLFFF